MLYLICPSCRRLLGDKQLPYERILEKICKDEEIKKITSKEADELKNKLVNSFKLNRYCDNMRLVTYAKLINIVK